MPQLDWTKEEFLCFLLIYAGYADTEFSEIEKLAIKNRFDAGIVEKMTKAFESMTDYGVLDSISQLSKIHYCGDNGKSEFISELNAIFNADGAINQMEKEVSFFLEKFIQIT